VLIREKREQGLKCASCRDTFASCRDTFNGCHTAHSRDLWRRLRHGLLCARSDFKKSAAARRWLVMGIHDAMCATAMMDDIGALRMTAILNSVQASAGAGWSCRLVAGRKGNSEVGK
jgi:hypothetical protein